MIGNSISVIIIYYRNKRSFNNLNSGANDQSMDYQTGSYRDEQSPIKIVNDNVNIKIGNKKRSRIVMSQDSVRGSNTHRSYQECNPTASLKKKEIK